MAEAKANCEKALQLSPDNANALAGLAICLAIEGHREEAIRMVWSPPVLLKNSNDKTYLYNVACVFGRSLEHQIGRAHV